MSRPSAEIAARMHQRTMKRGCVPIEVMSGSRTVFSLMKEQRTKTKTNKYFSGLSSLATPNGFVVCDWYQ